MTLDTTNVGGNATRKAKLTGSAAGSAYLTQEFSTPPTGQFSAQRGLYVDSILDRPGSSYDRAAWMFIGNDTGTTPDRLGPNAEDSERFVYLGFYKPGGGSSGTMDLVARESSVTETTFVSVATGLSLKRWYIIKVICDVEQDSYEVYLDGQLQGMVQARTPKSVVTHISFAQWSQDEGAATFYVDDVSAESLSATPTAACCGVRPGDRVILMVNTFLDSEDIPAAGLYAGTLGTVVCCDSDDPDLPLFVSWDGWANGKSNTTYCDPPVMPYTPNSGWRMSCDDIDPWNSGSGCQADLTPYLNAVWTFTPRTLDLCTSGQEISWQREDPDRSGFPRPA